MHEHISVKEFITQAEKAVKESESESEALRQLKPPLERLLANPNLPSAAFKPRDDRFAMNLIHMPEDKSLSVIGGVWKPGQTTPIHDHLTWALIGVYRGEERESLYRRLDDASNPKFARLRWQVRALTRRATLPY
jgi:predicted metal-dependent enzyme (double-stranded beta helix superfamily)